MLTPPMDGRRELWDAPVLDEWMPPVDPIEAIREEQADLDLNLPLRVRAVRLHRPPRSSRSLSLSVALVPPAPCQPATLSVCVCGVCVACWSSAVHSEVRCGDVNASVQRPPFSLDTDTDTVYYKYRMVLPFAACFKNGRWPFPSVKAEC